MPAHVTVLYPFLPPNLIGPDELRKLLQALSSVPRFAVTFTRVSWFGDDVVWLAPEPTDGFRALTAAIVAPFRITCPTGAHTRTSRCRTADHEPRPVKLF